MGSGRAGAGGGGGGGGTTFDLPRPTFGRTRSTKRTPETKVQSEVKRVIKGLSKEYLEKQFGSPITRSLYEQLFNLKVNIFQNKSWEGIKARYEITDGPGCLRDWVVQVEAINKGDEPDVKIRDTAQQTLVDFLLLALSHDDKVYYTGSSDQIISKLDQRIFNSTSAYFLGILIWRVLERQGKSLSEDVQIQLRDVAQAKSDRIIRSFENKFLHQQHKDKRITHQDLFTVIQRDTTWFIEELRK